MGARVQRPPMLNTPSAGPVRRLLSVVLAVLLAGGHAFVGARPAQAELTGLRDYSMVYTLHENGSVDVDLSVTADFSGTNNHGVLVRIPVRVAADDPALDRLYPLSQVAVTSPTGASAEFSISTTGGVATVRVGSANKRFGGTHRYRVTYTQRGVIDHDDEGALFQWGVADGWTAPINGATAEVNAPASPSTASCYLHFVPSETPCTSSRIVAGADPAGPARAVVAQTRIAADDAFLVVVRYPTGTFPDAEVRTAQRSDRGETATESGNLDEPFVVVLLGSATLFWLFLHRHGRSRRSGTSSSSGWSDSGWSSSDSSSSSSDSSSSSSDSGGGGTGGGGW